MAARAQVNSISGQLSRADPVIPPARAAAEYHAHRQPFTASQYTTTLPGPCSRAAAAGPQSHGIHETVISPGPHSWPFAHRSG